MEEYHKSILKDYMDADFNKRLHIFLEHRSLRTEFLLIDQNDLNLQKAPTFNPLNKVFDLISSGCRKYFGFESINVYSGTQNRQKITGLR